jgi:Asp-tRNA(Asn)/Glu-tRNA(Gln) amidotransferase A subunit family amidase
MASLSASAGPQQIHLVPGIASLQKIDCLTISASELQDLLTAGKITSLSLVETYFEQISRHNEYLRSVFQICPTALQQAKRLDAERRGRSVRGPLHGIPVLIKVPEIEVSFHTN